MKKYIVLEVTVVGKYESDAQLICDSRDEAIKTIFDFTKSYSKDLYPDATAECRKETSGDFDYSVWYITDEVEVCEIKYKIIEVEL